MAALKRALRRGLMPVADRAARGYVAGSRVCDAVRVCRSLAAHATPATIGYWNDSEDPPGLVHRAYLACLDALVTNEIDGYLSIKLPALDYERDRLDDVLARAAAAGLRVHLDSLGPEHAERTKTELERAIAQHGDLGCTLPGRWTRSLEDADWAARRALTVRIVKGQWEDPAEPDLDPREGFFRVAERLAGRARHVAVATHDLPLAERVLEMLGASNTPAELELLYGLPMRASRRLARRLRVPHRIYVPYGASWLPYTMEYVKKNPRVLFWFLKDRLGM